MIDQKKTVFVLGAGASKEVNLPIGSDLKKTIASGLKFIFDGSSSRLTSGDASIFAALKLVTVIRPSFVLESLVQKACSISTAMPLSFSIDNYLDAHAEDKEIELCGKLAIVQSILEAERNSLLHLSVERGDKKFPFGSIETTWFNAFFQLITLNCRKGDLEERLKSVVLIVFNYDRCIEHFLYSALQSYYSIGMIEAASLLQHIEIYHPYGTVGTLPWVNKTNGDNLIEFGGIPDPKQLLELSRQIKTFTEGTDASSSEI